MPEQIGSWILEPSLASIVDEAIDFMIQNSIPSIAEQAYNTIMMDWDSEQGYSSNGSPVPWSRSPKSKRTNPILLDTGVLKSSVDIVFFDGGAEFRFEATGGHTYKSGATVQEVSSYNDGNPHTNPPEEYMVGGAEWKRITNDDLVVFFRMKLSDNSIRRA